MGRYTLYYRMLYDTDPKTIQYQVRDTKSNTIVATCNTKPEAEVIVAVWNSKEDSNEKV